MADVDVKSSSTSTADIVGLDNIKLKLELPQPLKTEGSNALKIDLPQPFKTEGLNALKIEPLKMDLGTDSHLKVEPLKTDSSMTVDLKPAVVDLCMTLNVGKVPNLCIKQPYEHHVGFTMWGMEVWGFTFSGKQETFVQEQRPSPPVALGAPPHSWGGRHPPHHAPAPAVRETGGLRLRVEPEG